MGVDKARFVVGKEGDIEDTLVSSFEKILTDTLKKFEGYEGGDKSKKYWTLVASELYQSYSLRELWDLMHAEQQFGDKKEVVRNLVTEVWQYKNNVIKKRGQMSIQELLRDVKNKEFGKIVDKAFAATDAKRI